MESDVESNDMAVSLNGEPGDDLEGLAEYRVPPPFADEGSEIAFFSPHHLSHDQVEELEEKTGRSMSDVADLSSLAERHINTHNNVDKVWSGLQNRIQEMLEDAETVVLFGVFPPPIRAKFLQWSTERTPSNVQLYESFNSRVNGGGRGPDFNHIEWVKTGRFNLKFPSNQ